MHLIRTLGLALVAVGALATTTAESARNLPSTPSGKIIYDMTVPWPFRHGPVNDVDGDGVVDSKDACPATPAGAVVDAGGCPVDSDHDGVPDGIDHCENTRRGVTVDRYGCAIDSDRDGVPDGIDRCEGTPKGATVDAKGCPSDADADGVFDGIDKCDNTPMELAVDKKGCPIPVSDVAQRFLDGSAVAFNVDFASGKADIQPSSFDELDKVGKVLDDWPAAEVEIAGHTDAQGTEKSNQQLSKQRADAVKAYLVKKYSNIRARNLKTKGYGESRPVASNDAPEGRAQNRRVEFTLLNGGDLKKDVETRRYKRRNER